MISRVKLIAEPWDVGEGGYQVGNFPPGWSEWNGRYRDTVRDLWCRGGNVLGEFASRITGSSDLYEHDGRRPHASVNFVTAHDGFTLSDLVTYTGKRNWANGEDNRDGTDDDRSTNCGIEGPTDDPEVLERRVRLRRNLLATVLLSQGVPMLLGGDELGRTQLGNNNAYAQDNEVSWFDWEGADRDLADFTRAVVELRTSQPVFQRRRFLTGEAVDGHGRPDVAWFRTDGAVMGADDWHDGARAVVVWLNGVLGETDERGQAIVGCSALVVVNAGDAELAVRLPDERWGSGWRVRLDTSAGVATEGPAGVSDHAPAAVVPVRACSLLVLIDDGDAPPAR